MKIAVTSTNGVAVNQHFGKADTFYIYETLHGNLELIDKREVKSYCACVEDQPKDHGFDLDRFIQVFGTIKDCDMLYTMQIGDSPLKKLTDNGIKVQICSCEIESIVTCGGDCGH